MIRYSGRRVDLFITNKPEKIMKKKISGPNDEGRRFGLLAEEDVIPLQLGTGRGFDGTPVKRSKKTYLLVTLPNRCRRQFFASILLVFQML